MNLPHQQNIQTLILSDEETLFRLLEKFYDRISREKTELPEWVSEAEAMNMLGIKSKTTLWKLRSAGKISYSQMGKKVILYKRESIQEYIELNEQSKF